MKIKKQNWPRPKRWRRFLTNGVMISYSEIVKKAFYATITHPSLWLFGLFAVGGFNLNFLNFENVPLRKMVLEHDIMSLTVYSQSHPAVLAAASLAVLFFSLFGLVATNWSRIMLILLGDSIIKTQKPQVAEQIKKSGGSLWLVIQISMITVVFMLIVAGVLFVPPLLLDIDQSFKILLLEIGAVIFLPLAFAISCINIFTTFYAVLYKKTLTVALNLSTDFFVSRWTQILGLVAVLMVVYFACFVFGVALIFCARAFFGLLFLILAKFNIFSFSAIIGILKTGSNVLLWFLLAGLSAFFNQTLLILFFKLNIPIASENTLEQAKVSVAAHI